MSKPNTITKKEYPDIWDDITEEMTDDSWENKEHRRGSSFYITPYYHIYRWDGSLVPEELDGYWEADTCTWSDDWGLDDKPDVLYRVEPVVTERVVKETHYKRVTNES